MAGGRLIYLSSAEGGAVPSALPTPHEKWQHGMWAGTVAWKHAAIVSQTYVHVGLVEGAYAAGAAVQGACGAIADGCQGFAEGVGDACNTLASGWDAVEPEEVEYDADGFPISKPEPESAEAAETKSSSVSPPRTGASPGGRRADHLALTHAVEPPGPSRLPAPEDSSAAPADGSIRKPTFVRGMMAAARGAANSFSAASWRGGDSGRPSNSGNRAQATAPRAASPVTTAPRGVSPTNPPPVVHSKLEALAEAPEGLDANEYAAQAVQGVMPAGAPITSADEQAGSAAAMAPVASSLMSPPAAAYASEGMPEVEAPTPAEDVDEHLAAARSLLGMDPAEDSRRVWPPPLRTFEGEPTQDERLLSA